MSDLVADVFEMFRDGDWHTLKDVRDRFNIDHAAAEQIVRFLAKSRLLKLNADRSEAIIDPTVLRILEGGFPYDDSMREIARRLRHNYPY